MAYCQATPRNKMQCCVLPCLSWLCCLVTPRMIHRELVQCVPILSQICNEMICCILYYKFEMSYIFSSGTNIMVSLSVWHITTNSSKPILPDSLRWYVRAEMPNWLAIMGCFIFRFLRLSDMILLITPTLRCIFLILRQYYNN